MSGQRGERRVTIRSSFDEEWMSLDSLHAAERLFAKLAVRMLLDHTPELESAGPRLHRRAGRALTPREGGPVMPQADSPRRAESDREHGNVHIRRIA